MDARRVRASGAGWFARHPLRLAAVILVGALALAAAVVIVVLAFVDAAGHVRTTAGDNLIDIGRTRARLISDWRRERMYDADAVSHSPALREAVSHLVGSAPPDSHTYAGVRVAIAEDLALLQAEDAYVGSLLLDPSGKLLATSATDHAQVPQVTRDLVREVVAFGRPAIGLPFSVPISPADTPDVLNPAPPDTPDGPGAALSPTRASMDVAAPVFDEHGRVMAVVVLRLDPRLTLFDDVLAPLIDNGKDEASLLQWTADGVVEVSAETEDGLPAGLVEGKPPFGTAVSEAKVIPDRLYHGPGEHADPVVADVRKVEGSPWVVVTSRTAQDVDAEANAAGIEALVRVLAVMLLVAVVIGVLFVGRQRRLLKELLRAEQERAIAAGRVDDAMTYARDIVLLLDEHGRILDANLAAVKAYGYDLGTLRTMQVADLRAPSERGSVDADLESAQAPGGITLQTIHQRRDGETFPVEVATHALRGPGGLRFETAVRDIRDQVEAERAMQQQLDELRRWQAGAIGREERILELKAEINDLLQGAGKPTRYASVDQAKRLDDGL